MLRPLRPRSSSGQTLILFLLLVPTLVVFLFYLINTGLAVRHRVHTQNSADAVALANAEIYARTLNGLMISNKVWWTLAVVDLAAFMDTGIDPHSRKFISASQDILKAAGEGIMAAENAWIARQNGVLGFPASPLTTWNGSPTPHIAVRRRSMYEFLFGAGVPEAPEKKGPEGEFSYQPKRGGDRITVSRDEVYKDSRGRWRLREKGAGGMKDIFVKKDGVKAARRPMKAAMDADFDLVEDTDHHWVGTIVTRPGSRLTAGKRIPDLYARAQARIGRGYLHVFSFDFFEAYLEAVE